MESYLESARKQFLYYKMLGDKAMEQLPDDALFYKYNEESNSIAVIVNHMAGTMLSRFTDFLTSDGEKEWRNRDEEFDTTLQIRSEVTEKWERGWSCLLNALSELKTEDLEKVVYIRNEGHTVLEALNRQLAHYPYHVGQIVFIAKMIKDSDWKSLSIPRHQSSSYNAVKFAQEKGRRHFTDSENPTS
jgi:hypothetical protein